MVAVKNSLRARTVLVMPFAGFERTQNAELSFDGSSGPMGELRNARSNVHVVLVARGRPSVGQKRPVHHRGSESGAERADAGAFGVSVILMQANGIFGIHVGQRFDDADDHPVARIFAAHFQAGLQDHRRVARLGGIQDGQALFHVRDVESRYAVAVFGSVVQKLSE